MIRFLGRVGVGFPVSLPILCILAGGVENGFVFLFLSIVCTAGIGLVVWLPVWWIVGWATLALLAWGRSTLGDKPIGELPSVSSQEDLSFLEDQALTAYIRQAMAAGMDADEMTRRMLQNGWQKAEIKVASQSVILRAGKSDTNPMRKRGT